MTPQVTDGITLVDDMTLYEIMTKHYRWLVVQRYRRLKYYRLVDFIHLQHLLQVSNCSTLTITIVRVCDKNTSFSSKSATSQSYCILACCLFQNSIKKVAQRAMKMVKNIVAGLSTTYVTCQTKYLYNNML